MNKVILVTASIAFSLSAIAGPKFQPPAILHTDQAINLDHQNEDSPYDLAIRLYKGQAALRDRNTGNWTLVPFATVERWAYDSLTPITRYNLGMPGFEIRTAERSNAPTDVITINFTNTNLSTCYATQSANSANSYSPDVCHDTCSNAGDLQTACTPANFSTYFAPYKSDAPGVKSGVGFVSTPDLHLTSSFDVSNWMTRYWHDIITDNYGRSWSSYGFFGTSPNGITTITEPSFNVEYALININGDAQESVFMIAHEDPTHSCALQSKASNPYLRMIYKADVSKSGLISEQKERSNFDDGGNQAAEKYNVWTTQVPDGYDLIKVLSRNATSGPTSRVFVATFDSHLFVLDQIPSDSTHLQLRPMETTLSFSGGLAIDADDYPVQLIRRLFPPAAPAQ